MAKLKFRRDTVSNWNLKDPTLAEGEIGLILNDNRKTIAFKFGDGKTKWTELSNFTTSNTENEAEDYEEVIEFSKINSTTIRTSNIEGEDMLLSCSPNKLTFDMVENGIDPVGLYYDSNKNVFWLDCLEPNDDDTETQVIYFQWDAVENYPASSNIGTTFNPQINAAGTYISSAVKPTNNVVYTSLGVLVLEDEFNNLNTNKLYINTTDNTIYRWSGSNMILLNDVSSLETRLVVLESKLKQSLKSNLSTIEAGIATIVKLTGEIGSEITSINDSVKADSITIKVPNNTDGIGTNVKTFSKDYNLEISDNSFITATMEITYLGSKLPAQSVTIYGRHKIFFGFGTNANAVLGGSNYKLSTSAKTTYTDISKIDELSQFYICVPDYVTQPTSFKDDQGYGATLTKDTNKVTYNNTDYTIFHTDGAGYAKGTKITLIGG